MTSPTTIRAALFSALALGCASGAPVSKSDKPQAKGKATVEEAEAFVQRLDGELRRLLERSQTAEWIKSTYITEDTERNAAAINEELNAFTTQSIAEAARFDGLSLSAPTRRMLNLLKLQATLPAPNDPKKRSELTTIAAKLEGMYGSARVKIADTNYDLQQLEDVLKTSRDEIELRIAWQAWHAIAVPMRPLYQRLVAIGDEGAKEIGFADVGEIWRSGYDMPAADVVKEAHRLWEQTKPLYDALHCHVRAMLVDKYGSAVDPHGPIPAHLLGNMWAQTWENIYPLVEPFPGAVNLDVESQLREQNYDALKMTRLAESFFTSLGLDALPQTFWERSMFVKPRDREVVCHASAWDLDTHGDVRIKMCIKVDEEDLETLHHELGHDYYSWYRRNQPTLFNGPANDGFDEAIGDAIQHSVTPGYLKRVGLLAEVPFDRKGIINVQMKEALSRVSFLPFGLLIDEWRWNVFSGKTPPERYNADWWKLREEVQGVRAPTARTEADFDPGAKYHIPANVPYLRYFFAAILQYQFHRALCKAAGFSGTLHECSIYGNKEAGARFGALLALGASKPWQDALEALSGERTMDASAMLDYFAPLKKWLDQQNAGRQCGWK
jgi:peptidyl-dipeptidase A